MTDIFLFLICIVLIFFFSKASADLIKRTSFKFKISKSFLGFSIVSISTSFPEIVNCFLSAYDTSLPVSRLGVSKFFYNVTGSNFLQDISLLVLFGVGMLCWNKDTSKLAMVRSNDIRKEMVDGSHIFKRKLWSIYLAHRWDVKVFIFLNVSIFLMFLWGSSETLMVGKMNLLNILFPICWVIAMCRMYKSSDVDAEDKGGIFKHVEDKLSLLFLLTGTSIAFCGLAYWNWTLISKLTIAYGLGDVVGFGLILSLSASLPELIHTGMLLKRKEHESAVAVLLGSNIFNLSLLCLNNALVANRAGNIVNASYADERAMLLWQLSCTATQLILAVTVNLYLKGWWLTRYKPHKVANEEFAKKRRTLKLMRKSFNTSFTQKVLRQFSH